MTFLTRGAAAACLATTLLTTPAFAEAQDCSAGPIAETPVKGTVGGKPFIPNDVSIQITKDGFGINNDKFDAYELSIMAGGIFNAATVHFLVRDKARADGKTFRVLPIDSISGQPAAMEGVPEVQGWDLQLEAANVDTSFTQTTTASIRLELGQRKGNMLPGRIHFCVPSEKAEIAGTFNAKIGQ